MNIIGIYDKLDNTVSTGEGKLVDVNTLNDVLYGKKYIRYGGSDYRGYIEKGKAYIAPYSGRYGNGYCVATHAYRKDGTTSTKYMTVWFCVKRENDNGKS